MSDDPPAGGPEGADEDREDPEEPRDSSDTEPADNERAPGETVTDGADEDPETVTSDDGDSDGEPEEPRPTGDYVEPPGEGAPPAEADSADDEEPESGTGDEDEADASSDQVDEETEPETEEDGDEGAEDGDEDGVDDEEDDDEAGDGDEAGVDAAADSDEEEDEGDGVGNDDDGVSDEDDGAGDEDGGAGDEDDEAAEEPPGEGEETDAEDHEDDEEDEEDADEDDESGGTTVEMHDDSTPIQRKTGPASDKEQPLADHIEEMVKRLAVVVVVAGAVSLLAFPFGEDFILFLWYSVLPADISQPHVYHPLELVITQLKAASLLGLVIALPVFVYETYAFMRPGLYPHERRYYLAAVPTSLVLAFVGLLFGYFIVLPAVMNYFLYYSDTVVDIAFALGQTFSLMLILLGYLAIVFQIPLFVMLAIMMGLTTRVWLEDRRLIFWGAFLGISFLFSPDPTGMAPIVIAATMVALFEGTLLMLRWTGRG